MPGSMKLIYAVTYTDGETKTQETDNPADLLHIGEFLVSVAKSFQPGGADYEVAGIDLKVEVTR